MHHQLLPVVDMLRKRNATVDSPVLIEDIAAAAGIDIEAPFSYREVAELAERVAYCPYISRTWRGDSSPTYYSAGAYIPHDADIRAKDAADLAPFMAADCGCGGGEDCDEPAASAIAGKG